MEIVKKKGLGQFFSGRAVASLLIHLSKSSGAENVIDPMCGTGDMLMTFASEGRPDSKLTGIEIDKIVYSYAVNRLECLSGVRLINANVFSDDTLRDLSSGCLYDLVITNPPYVRRQTIDGSGYGIPGVLNLGRIRENLIDFVRNIQSVNDRERQLFAMLISQISGLADLAVPAWILCSLIVKKGGKIAMVLPETWLSRDYAIIIKYILLRFFKLEYIVEDANSIWFKTAQVKTILLVAERIDCRESLLDWKEDSFSYVTLYSDAAVEGGLVSNIFPESNDHEKEFIKAVDSGASIPGFFENKKILIKDFAEELSDQSAGQKWFQLAEPKFVIGKAANLPLKGMSDLRLWCNGVKVEFCKLEDLGVNTGQGLRTGANSFFYLDYKDIAPDKIEVFPDAVFKVSHFEIGKTFFKEVVRKQVELDSGFSLCQFQAKGVVLFLQSDVLPEDISSIVMHNGALVDIYRPVPDLLARYIRRAAITRNGDTLTARFIPDLSAVCSNVRLWNEKKPFDIPRFWYMLPAFSQRHFPDLFLPRVNTVAVKTRLNIERRYLIDANFSSLWIQDGKSLYNPHSLLALMNSTYAIVAMEEYGTTMGGGALKLEATQLKRIPIPRFGVEILNDLTELGKKLAVSGGNAATLLDEVDRKVLGGMGFDCSINQKQTELDLIKRQLLKKRVVK